MKRLKSFRVLISLLFIAACTVYIVFGPAFHPFAKCGRAAQIVLTSLPAGMGALLFWLGASLLFGRIYCSTVCPVGTLQDIVAGLRMRIPALRRNYRYRHPMQFRIPLMVALIVCIIIGITAVSFTVQPWNIYENIVTLFRPSLRAQPWIHAGISVTTGIVAGIVSLLLIVVWAWIGGRGFCNTICPIGTALGAVDSFTLFHIEIDPDRCTSCLRCEEVCKGECVKVVSRYVDNSRCVRCFNCIDACPDDAIRFQINRNRPATPLMKRTKRTPGT